MAVHDSHPQRTRLDVLRIALSQRQLVWGMLAIPVGIVATLVVTILNRRSDALLAEACPVCANSMASAPLERTCPACSDNSGAPAGLGEVA